VATAHRFILSTVRANERYSRSAVI